MGFPKPALMCFDLLAWPLFSLGFPLYASVRAIETNSMLEMRNLVAYWILFSLISLFELTFGTLIQWLPFWPYIKLMTICWLVLPRFDGACYVYEHLIHRWLSVNLKELINLIIKPKKSTSLDAERFLSMAEKFVKENGSEALEKLIAGKSEHRNPDIDTEDIKGVTNTKENGSEALEKLIAGKSEHRTPDIDTEDIKGVTNTNENGLSIFEFGTVALLSPPKVRNVALENAKAGDLKEKDLAATERNRPKELAVAKENAKAEEVKEKDIAATERVECVEPGLAQTEKKTVAAGEIKENAKAGEVKEKDIAATERVECVELGLAQTEKKTVAAGEIKEKLVMEEPGPEQVPREWTCAACQWTTTCEKNLNSHLQGNKHKVKCEELKASKNKRGLPSTTSGWEQKRPNSGDIPNPNKPNKQEDKMVQEMQVSQQQLKQNSYELWCGICNVGCPSWIHMESHLRGKEHLFQRSKHLFQIQDTLGS